MGMLLQLISSKLTAKEVKYRRYGKASGPEFVINKNEFLRIQAPDGEIIFPSTPVQLGRSNNSYKSERVLEPLVDMGSWGVNIIRANWSCTWNYQFEQD